MPYRLCNKTDDIQFIQNSSFRNREIKQINMALSNRIKHLLQCICLFSWIFLFCYFTGGIRFGEDPLDNIDPWSSYGTVLTIVLIVVRLLALLALPHTLCNLLGTVFFLTFVIVFLH